MDPLRPAAVVAMAMSGTFPAADANASPAAIRRLQRDYQKLIEEPLPGIHALPTDANILEWHYVIEGSPETHYYGGYYHGKIVFQPEFPWKPPAICMCTPSGRFRTNMRLCLSISDYHPETWNPGWTVSSILVGLHSFMNEETYAAGVQNDTPELRRRYAENSINYNLNNPEFTRMFPSLAEVLRAVVSADQTPPPHSTNNTAAAETPPLSATRKRALALAARDNSAAIPEKKTAPPPPVIDLTDD